MTHLSRRHLLKGLGAAGFASSMGALTGLAGARAWAAETSGYKAMVCIFLKGGMDQSDTILPFDQTSYDQLATTRAGLFNTYRAAGDGTSSRDRENLLELTPTNAANFGGRAFAMPSALSPLQQLFSAGELAVVGNVGPLIEPTTRAQMANGTALLPPRLFSHNDQQSIWMSLQTEGARYGWGGRFMDAVLKASPSASATFAGIATGSNDVFLSGETTRPMRVGNNGVAPEPFLTSKRGFTGGTAADAEARDKIRAFLARNSQTDRNVFAQDLAAANRRAIENSELLSEAHNLAAPLTTEFGGDGLSKQMKSVAETIKVQQYLNVPRQIFYVTLGGFDTHNTQATSLAGNHTALSNAITSFRAAMLELGRWQDVAVFTASDFGRTVIDNGDGTDHGWGGHHLVVGGSVRGNQIYGDIPDMDLTGPQYTESRGRLIPTTAVEQYAATLGRWFGLSGDEIGAALPNLANFASSDLGFMA